MSDDKSSDPTGAESPHCLNCDARLSGQYCGRCGQRAQGRLISVLELLRDAFGDLLDVDSRLWQTLYRLAFRPGTLTVEYLRGRRARYMPPFRTYLVLSLLFFAIAFFDPRDFGILFEPTDVIIVTDETDAPARQELIDELAKESDTKKPGFSVDFGSEDSQTDCNIEDYDPAELPSWLGRRLTKERMQAACLRLVSEDGQALTGLASRLLELVPAGLLVLLPLMALVLKVLYPLSRRYYVEHLLLVVHFHAFVFLALTAQALLSRSGTLVGLPDLVMMLLLLPVPVYIPVYLYKTLRRVYGQGHWLTAFKYLLLQLAYVTGLSAMLLIAVIFAVFSV